MAQVNIPVLSDKCWAHPNTSINSLHPCPSAPIRNMQESVPAGHSKFHRKFLKPIPKVLLIIEIKTLPHYPCAEQYPGTDPKAAKHVLILP